MRRTGANVATAFRLWSPITTSMPRLKTSENARRAPSPPVFSSIGKCSKLQGSTPLMDGLYTRLAQSCASGVHSHHIPHVRGPPIIGREKGERECRGGGDREREKGKGGGRECAEGGQFVAPRGAMCRPAAMKVKARCARNGSFSLSHASYPAVLSIAGLSIAFDCAS